MLMRYYEAEDHHHEEYQQVVLEEDHGSWCVMKMSGGSG